jgi:hypothetical protein
MQERSPMTSVQVASQEAGIELSEQKMASTMSSPCKRKDICSKSGGIQPGGWKTDSGRTIKIF